MDIEDTAASNIRIDAIAKRMKVTVKVGHSSCKEMDGYAESTSAFFGHAP